MKKAITLPLLVFIVIGLFSIACKNEASPTQTPTPASTPPSTTPQATEVTMPKEVVLNGLTWTTENQDIELPDSWCYDNVDSYCKEYGRLYSWSAANKACQSLGEGWRLPTEEEFLSMISQFGEAGISPIGSTPSAFRKLLKGGEAGFGMVRGGTRTFNGHFADLGDQAYFWTSTPTPGYDEGTYRGIFFQSSAEIVGFLNFSEKQGASCRCVKE